MVERSLWVREVTGSHPGEVAERSKALRQGRNLFGGVGSNPTLVTFSGDDRMAEWSKAPDPSSGLFGGAGSNPAPVTELWSSKSRNAHLAQR